MPPPTCSPALSNSESDEEEWSLTTCVPHPTSRDACVRACVPGSTRQARVCSHIVPPQAYRATFGTLPLESTSRIGGWCCCWLLLYSIFGAKRQRGATIITLLRTCAQALGVADSTNSEWLSKATTLWASGKTMSATSSVSSRPACSLGSLEGGLGSACCRCRRESSQERWPTGPRRLSLSIASRSWLWDSHTARTLRWAFGRACPRPRRPVVQQSREAAQS